MKKTKDGKIITVLGTNGIGKSIFSIIYASNIENKKTLIIDFDIMNSSMHNLLGVKKYTEKIVEKAKKNINYQNNISSYIIKTKLGIDLISGINLIATSSNHPQTNKIKNIINEIKRKYDIIIIDTASQCFLEYTKELMNLSDNLIFISGANKLEIIKTQRMLELYKEEWNIPKEKINIIFNKYTKQSIDDEVLKQIFKDYQILGKIRLNDYYDLAINKNNSKEKQIQNDIKKIKKKIVRRKIIRY